MFEKFFKLVLERVGKIPERWAIFISDKSIVSSSELDKLAAAEFLR